MTSTTWNVDDQVTVTWNTSGIPPPGSFTGLLFLGFLKHECKNLDIDHPVAQDILLSSGSVQITVPKVPVGANYIVVLHDHRRVQYNHDPESISHFHNPFPSPHPSVISHSDDISHHVFPPTILPHLPASSHAHRHVNPWNLHRNVPDLFPIKQHVHAELGHICHECAKQLSVYVLERNDQQCAPCSTCLWRSRDHPLCGGRCNGSRTGFIT
ncbi:hypothetical protein EDB89DRAFT_1583236 [Lactarius sanguifluus]|nr:hypothetical protein EDB89DRAFT_1583236 [Lactarius sanguifluus]